MVERIIVNLKHNLNQVVLTPGKRYVIVEQNADGTNPVVMDTIPMPNFPGLLDATLFIGISGQVKLDSAALTDTQRAALLKSTLKDRLDFIDEPAP